MTYDYVILGNSAAGVAGVEAIRRYDKTASIRMVSPEPYNAYGRPLISYVLEGKTTLEAMELRKASFYHDKAIETSFGSDYEALSLDSDAHTVALKNGEVISYGKVLVAIGSIPFVPPIPGLSQGVNTSSFLTLDQALTIRDELIRITRKTHDEHRTSRACVVGGGLIGLKAAEAVCGFVDEVVVLEMAPRLLPAVLDDAGASILAEELTNRGIVCMPGITAREFDLNQDTIVGAWLTDDSYLACDYVIVAVGVRPNIGLLEAAGAEIDKGVVCGSDMQTSLPDVYAAGDCTQTNDVLDGSKKCLALWPNAVWQGRVAGLHMAGAPAKGLRDTFMGNFAVNSVDFFDDVYLLTAGVINPAPEAGFSETVYHEGNRYIKFVIKDDRLYGFITLNRPENAGIYTSLITMKIPLSSLARPLGPIPENMDFSDDLRWLRLHMGYPEELDRNGWKERA